MIAVLGLGFVGLTTALGFSKKGFRVRGFDVDKTKASVIASGKIPFFEADMQEVLDEQLNHNFTVSDTLADAVSNSKVIFLCVGTPSDEKGKADLTYLLTAVGDILKSVQKGSKKIIVVKSTVPPSTTRDHVIPFIESKGFKIGEDVIVSNNPEFLREGHAWKDFIEPDRIVIGTQDDYAKTVLGEIYAPFAVPIHYVSLNTGEFIKYLSNTLLSTLISYSNEMSMIAMTIGDIDTRKAFQILHEDKRWGEDKTCMMASYAFPGCGFGGYCLPKDTQAMAYKAGEFGYNAKILKDVLAVNAEIKPFWIEKITENLPKTATIGVLGLSFKPHSDDIRQTPAKAVLEQLLAKGYTNIVVYDPIANDLFDRTYKLPLTYKKSVKEVADCADVVAVVTAWPEFRENEALLKGKKVFDLRYCL
ncbi:MAG: UDP-glucose/GDP-mannose dehydrogenase family protein [Alphaproteobacteria bacterium]|nr:UDP-glucose/GDP-mannose dehydrogenase family protein [Alphaproteobacteria bacterium]